MVVAGGEDVAVVLLRALPADVAALLLGRLPKGAPDRLRAKLSAASGPPTDDELDAALTEFFDLQRIAERPPPAAPPPAPPDAAADPAAGLRGVPPDRLGRALEGESAAVGAIVLAALDPAAAGQVLKRLPPDLRADVGLRLAKPGPVNHVLARQVVRAVADKAGRLDDVPAAPSADERITNLADMLRSLPRPERVPVLQRLATADPDVSAKIRDLLYRMEDFLKVPDRQMQALLGELDVKRLALALKGADPEVKARMSANMSSRSRTLLDEETEILGTPPAVRVREAQQEVLAVFRRFEEEGRIVIEE